MPDVRPAPTLWHVRYIPGDCHALPWMSASTFLPPSIRPPSPGHFPQVSPAYNWWFIDDAIETALGGNFSALETNFGVLKTLTSPTTLTLTLGSAPGLFFNVTAADIIFPVNPIPAVNCTWANPLMASKPITPSINFTSPAVGMT